MFKWILKIIGVNPKDDSQRYSGCDGGTQISIEYAKQDKDTRTINWYYVDYENKSVFYDPNFTKMSPLDVFLENR